MISLSRRDFLKGTAAMGGMALTSSLRPTVWARPIGANEAVRVAVIGFRQKGASHIRQLLGLPGVRLVGLCDVDPVILAREVEALKNRGIEVFATTDARVLLERDDIDAVVVATCNHWHALMTVWACQAGKDVYVEKPVSHSIWEGRKMVEAAAKHGRIVQAGSQLRSDAGVAEAVRTIREGNLGRIRSIHGVCYSRREAIGRRMPWYPEGIDYSLWSGPAPMVPLERRELHYDWHWMWDTGNGELANIGAHVLDIASRFLPAGSRPSRVLSLGGRFLRDDVAETPNTQLAVYDWSAVPVLFEVRGLPAKPGASYMDQFRGIRTGVVVECEGGSYAGYVGGTLRDCTGKEIRKVPGDGGGLHMGNFIAAVRSRRVTDLAAPIEVGHEAASLCHLANLSYRVGETSSPAMVRTALAEHAVALEAFDRAATHLAAHGIDLERQLVKLGPWLPMTERPEELREGSGLSASQAERVRFLLKGLQRQPFAIPEQV